MPLDLHVPCVLDHRDFRRHDLPYHTYACHAGSSDRAISRCTLNACTAWVADGIFVHAYVDFILVDALSARALTLPCLYNRRAKA